MAGEGGTKAAAEFIEGTAAGVEYDPCLITAVIISLSENSGMLL